MRDAPILLPFEPLETAVLSESDKKRPIWDIVLEMADAHPEDELDRIPHDAALNHDHYLCGAPKKQAGTTN